MNFGFRPKRGLVFCVLGILCFAIVITVVTASASSQQAGLYALYVGECSKE